MLNKFLEKFDQSRAMNSAMFYKKFSILLLLIRP